MTSELGAQVRQSLGWSAMSTLVLRSGSVLVGIVLARLLGPEQFGVFAVALTVQAVLMSLTDLGLTADLIRHDDPESRAPSVATLGLVVGGLLALLTALSAGAMAELMGSPPSAPAIRVLALTILLAGAGVVPFAMLQRRFQQRTVFVIALIDLAVYATVTTVMLLTGFGVLSLAWGRLVAQSVTLVLQFKLSGTRPRFGFDRGSSRSVLAFGMPVAAANVLAWGLLNVDNIVIARIGGPVALGFYVLAFNISTWPMSIIGQVVKSVALPGFARVDEVDGAAVLSRAISLTWMLALPAGVGLTVLATPVVDVIYGASWSPAAGALAALALFGALRVVFDLLVAYLLSRSASGAVLVVQLGWFVVMIPAVVLATLSHGFVGAAWVHLVVAWVVVLPAYLVVLRRQGVPALGVLRGLATPLPAAVAAGLGSLLVLQLLDGRVPQLVGGGLVLTVVYLALSRRGLLDALRETSPRDDLVLEGRS